MGDDGASWAAAQREAGPALATALASRALGCAGALAAAGEGYGAVAARDLAAGEAFLFAHELDFTCRGARAALSGAGGAAARHALAAVGSACDEDAAWRHAEASPPGADASADTRFALPCADVLRLRHVDAAGAAALGVAQLPAQQAAALGMRHGGCVAWTRRALAAGEEATRDAAPGKRTVSRAAALLALLSPPRWAHASERGALIAAVAAAAAASPVPPATRRAPATQSSPLVDPESPVCVYTDYALLADELRALSSNTAESSSPVLFEVADEPAGIDVLWLNQPLRDFASLPAGLFVNQFPFEGCLVRKDLLPQTCRMAAGGGWPAWFPESYDVATEAAQFLAAHAASGGDGAATWVLKRAGGTHSADAAVTLPCARRSLLVYSARHSPTGGALVNLVPYLPMVGLYTTLVVALSTHRVPPTRAPLTTTQPPRRFATHPNRAQVADSGPRVNRVKQCLARCPLLRCLFVLPTMVTAASPPNPHAAAAAAAGCLK